MCITHIHSTQYLESILLLEWEGFNPQLYHFPPGERSREEGRRPPVCRYHAISTSQPFEGQFYCVHFPDKEMKLKCEQTKTSELRIHSFDMY